MLKECASVRNEIYAVHGYSFQPDEWKNYFGSKEWYTPDLNFDVSKFNGIEKLNLEYIEKFEKMVSTSFSFEENQRGLEAFIKNYNNRYVEQQYQQWFKQLRDYFKKDNSSYEEPEIKYDANGNMVMTSKENSPSYFDLDIKYPDIKEILL